MRKQGTFFALLLILLFLTACGGEMIPPPPEEPDVSPAETPETPPEQEEEEAPEDPGEAALQALLKGMTLEEKAGQLFFVRVPAENALEDIMTYHLGGYLLFGRDTQDKTANDLIQTIASWQAEAVEHGTDRLSDSIGSSRQALGESVQKVQETSEMFHQIIHAADGAANVQAEITQVLDTSKIALNSVCGFFDKIKDRYQEVVGHIERVSKLGTTKSAMFEDVDHMLSQIPPIVKE